MKHTSVWSGITVVGYSEMNNMRLFDIVKVKDLVKQEDNLALFWVSAITDRDWEIRYLREDILISWS